MIDIHIAEYKGSFEIDIILLSLNLKTQSVQRVSGVPIFEGDITIAIRSWTQQIFNFCIQKGKGKLSLPSSALYIILLPSIINNFR